MVIFTEEKHGQQSIFYKRILDSGGTEVSSRKVSVPLFQEDQEGITYFVLYDDQMNVIREFYEYLNYSLASSPLTTRRKAAFALRLLYCFLSLSRYDVHHLSEQALDELVFFLRGIQNNPGDYYKRTQRSADTVNGYLSVYRSYFKDRDIKCDPIFRSHTVSISETVEGSFTSTTEHIRYDSSLRASTDNSCKVPPYVSPDEFRRIYTIVRGKEDPAGRLLLHLMYGYGLRLGECLGLTTEDIQEIHKDGKLVPILILRNRLSDTKFQYAKNLMHVQSAAQYMSHDYRISCSEIVITYELYEELISYIESAHADAMEKYPKNYTAGAADIVSLKDRPEHNHYVFLGKYGRILSDQAWNTRLKSYFSEAGIQVDHHVKEKNLSHRFRHGFAMFHARFSEHPVDALVLSRMMRHRSILSTMAYYNPTPEDELKTKTEFQEELYSLIPELKEVYK